MRQYFLTFVAGMIATLSPCVLPALPLIGASALQSSKWGPVFLGLGLTASFTVSGLLVSGVFEFLNVDPGLLREFGAGLLILMGIALWSNSLQSKLSSILGAFANFGSKWSSRSAGLGGVSGQLLSGALLGAIWSPCSGPLLGAALGLAATSGQRTQGALLMMLFGLGSALPLVALSYGSKAWLMKNRSGLGRISKTSKAVTAILFVVTGGLVVSGMDKVLEAKLLDVLPQGWVSLISK